MTYYRQILIDIANAQKKELTKREELSCGERVKKDYINCSHSFFAKFRSPESIQRCENNAFNSYIKCLDEVKKINNNRI